MKSGDLFRTMEKNILINLTILVMAFLIHDISCDSIPKGTATTDMKFELFGYEHESLEKKFVGLVEEVEYLKSALEKINKVGIDAAAAQIPGLGEAKSAIEEYLEDIIKEKKGKIEKKAEADAVENEIEYYHISQQLFNIENKLTTLRYELHKKSFGNTELKRVDDQLFGIIHILAESDSPFYKYPALALKILLPLATVVESFMRKLEKSRLSFAKPLHEETEVPCMLQLALGTYLKPIMFDRLNAIRVNTDQYKSAFKYSNIHLIIDSLSSPDPNPNGAQFIRCQQINADENEYESEVKKQLPRYKMGSFLNSVGKAAWTLLKFIAMKQIPAVNNPLELFLELNEDKSDRVYLRDSLGEKNVYYIGEDGTDDCVRDYFLIVKSRITKEMRNAYSKVVPFCTDHGVLDRYERTSNLFIK